MPDTPFHQWTDPDGSLWLLFFRQGADYLLRFPGFADFEVSADGRDVRCRPVPATTAATIRHLYLNQVLPLALSRQGSLVFHASAIAIDARAVAFVGMSGRGKSTLAASFATHGHRFLTDDGLQVEWQADHYRAMPSQPSVRLWRDSEAAVLDVNAVTAPPLQFTSKSRFLAGNELAFCDQPLRLEMVCFLGDGSAAEPSFEAIQPSEALIELVKHSFLLDIEARQMLATHFDALADMVGRQRNYRLDYPRDFADLARVRQAIIEHARRQDVAA